SETVEQEAIRRFAWAFPPESDKEDRRLGKRRDWKPTRQAAYEQVRRKQLSRNAPYPVVPKEQEGSDDLPRRIPGDELGRYWVRAQFDGIPRQEERALVTLVSMFDGHVEVIGNAFILMQQGKAAICLTAAHCFEEIKRKQRPERPAHHITLPEDFRNSVI